MYMGATDGKAPKAWALLRFWVSIRSYKKQPVKKIWGRILGLVWLKFAVAPLPVFVSYMKRLSVFYPLLLQPSFPCVAYHSGKPIKFSLNLSQRYTYRVLQTIQMKLILSCVQAERAVSGSDKTALKFKYEIHRYNLVYGAVYKLEK